MLLPLWPLLRDDAGEETPRRTLRSCFRELAACMRGIAGDFGVRPYRVYIETSTWTAEERGQKGGVSVTTNEITEGPQLSPPKVEWLDDSEIAFNDLSAGEVRIGPVTPDYVDADGTTKLGGTDLATLAPTPANRNSTVRVKLVGPKHPNGAYFRIANVEHHRGYQYVLVLTRASEGSVIA